MAVCENGFRGLHKSQLNLQGQISLRFTDNLEPDLYFDVRHQHAIFGSRPMGGRMFRCGLKRAIITPMM